jgi:hypothetical protein
MCYSPPQNKSQNHRQPATPPGIADADRSHVVQDSIHVASGFRVEMLRDLASDLDSYQDSYEQVDLQDQPDAGERSFYRLQKILTCDNKSETGDEPETRLLVGVPDIPKLE